MYKITYKNLELETGQKRSVPLKECKAIVLHTDLGTTKGTYNQLKNYKVAYNFYIPRENDDEIIKYIPITNGAYAQGKISNPIDEVDKIFGKTYPNEIALSICYGGRGVDKKGNVVRFGWSTVVDGQQPTESQIKRGAYLIKEILRMEDKPIFTHKELTSYKQTYCVYNFRDSIINSLKKIDTNLVLLRDATVQQLIDQITIKLK